MIAQIKKWKAENEDNQDEEHEYEDLKEAHEDHKTTLPRDRTMTHCLAINVSKNRRSVQQFSFLGGC